VNEQKGNAGQHPEKITKPKTGRAAATSHQTRAAGRYQKKITAGRLPQKNVCLFVESLLIYLF